MINWNGNSGGAVVFVSLFLAVMAEAWIMGADNVSFSDNTVTGFEINEAGLSAVLTNAIEDQRAIVAYITSDIQAGNGVVRKEIEEGNTRAAMQLNQQVEAVKVLRFQAIRVLGLLKDQRNSAGDA